MSKQQTEGGMMAPVSGDAEEGMAWKQRKRGYLHVVVRYSFLGELDFERVSAYMAIGAFREVIAQQLHMELHTVALLSDGRVLRMNNATLEEALGNTLAVCYVDLAYYSAGSRFYAHSVLWPGMDVHSLLRRECIRLVEWVWFDRVTLLCILLNVLFMCLNEPLQPDDQPFNVFCELVDLVFTIFFTFEMVVKVLAQGFLLAKHSYLRDGWNWVDFVVVISAWATFRIPGADGGKTQLTPLRSFRVLRPLRTVTRIKGMRVVVQSLLHSLPQMGQVAVLLAFHFLLFGVTGVQLFNGRMHHRCIPDSIALEPCSYKGGDYPKECLPTVFSAACIASGGADPAGLQTCLPMFADAYTLQGYDAMTCEPPDDDAYRVQSNCRANSTCAHTATASPTVCLTPHGSPTPPRAAPRSAPSRRPA